MKDGPEATEARRVSIPSYLTYLTCQGELTDAKYSETEMRRKLKGNEGIADAIIPKNFAVGCRRPTPGEGFLEALTEPNVTVHTKQMQRITETGFISHDVTAHDVDVIICATGFDTSWVPRFPVKARGKNIQEMWRENGAMSYLAVAVPEMPNYFTFAGPVGVFELQSSLMPNTSTNGWDFSMDHSQSAPSSRSSKSSPTTSSQQSRRCRSRISSHLLPK